MNAREAYEAATSRQRSRMNAAHADGWALPEYHDGTVIMRNRRTCEVAMGRRRWAASANRWGKRVSFAA